MRMFPAQGVAPGRAGEREDLPHPRVARREDGAGNAYAAFRANRFAAGR